MVNKTLQFLNLNFLQIKNTQQFANSVISNELNVNIDNI